MTGRTKQIGAALVALAVLALSGCAPTTRPPTHVPMSPGGVPKCPPPPADVFTAAGLDIGFAQSTFGRVVTGDFDFKSDPEVISLASQAVTDQRILVYLRCLAIHRDRYTNEQAAYFTSTCQFLSTEPSPDQFLKWQREKPFPGAKPADREDVTQLPLEQEAGHSAIAKLVNSSVLDSSVYYRDYTYNATFHDLTPSPGLTETKLRALLRIAATHEFTVVNPSDELQTYTYSPQHFNLIPNPDIQAGSLRIDLMLFEWIENGQVEDRLKVDLDQIEQEREQRGSVELARREIEIEPGQEVRIAMKTTSWELRDYGELAVLLSRKTLNMKLRVVFPNESLVGFPRPKVTHFHPQRLNVASCDHYIDTDNGTVEAWINGGILPYNGILITWRMQP